MLNVIGKIYGLVTGLRNALYDRGIFRSYSLGARTISIGNITTGGTGKTPLVAYVAEILAEAGEKVCILTRGYGRKSSGRVVVSDGQKVLVDAVQGGDEPVELARQLMGKALVVADANRVSAAAWAKEKFGITAFVLDDGFQHRRAKRDLDVVCVDATDPLGSGRVLPAGRLREPSSNLARATAIVLTRADLVENVNDSLEHLRKQNPRAKTFQGRNPIVGFTPLGDFGTPAWTSLRSCRHDDDEIRILAFCGLGNPDSFFRNLLGAFEDASTSDEFDLTILKRFPDHHRYSQNDIVELEKQAGDAGIHALITTSKDAVKLEGLKFDLPCFVARGDFVINDPDGFRDLVLSA